VSLFSVIGPIDTEGVMFKIDRRPKLMVTNVHIAYTELSKILTAISTS